MKFTLSTPKPRNPVAAARRTQGAGAHRRAAGGQRQLARRALRREIEHLHPPSL